MKCFFCGTAEAVGKMTNKVNVTKDACLDHLIAGLSMGWKVDDKGLKAIEANIEQVRRQQNETRKD